MNKAGYLLLRIHNVNIVCKTKHLCLYILRGQTREIDTNILIIIISTWRNVSDFYFLLMFFYFSKNISVNFIDL